MHDIPLSDAIIAANSPACGRQPIVLVYRAGDSHCLGFDVVVGAGEARWNEHPDHRLGFLHEIMWHLAHLYRIPTATIHAAMQCIPEYRELEGNELSQWTH